MQTVTSLAEAGAAAIRASGPSHGVRLRLAAFFLTVVAMAFGLCIEPAFAERRVALVIGNSDYENVSKLTNPKNDSLAMVAALKAAGFDDVELAQDLGQSQLLRKLRDFSSAVAGADIAVVYYAGHGVEADGRNYLVPTDATLANAKDVEFEAIALDSVRASVSSAKKLRVVILDACRNNPFKLASTDGKRSVTRGLARVEPGANELIAYAAREGTVANDGSGSNSPYAESLVKHLGDPGLDVRILFGKVRDEVLAATGGQQEPFMYATLGGEALSINAAAPAADPAPAAATAGAPVLAKPANALSSEAAQLWPIVEKTTSCGIIQSFIDRFSKEDSAYIDFAKARKADLNCTVASNPVPVVEDQAAADAGNEPAKPAKPAGKPVKVASLDPAKPVMRTINPSILPVGKWAEGIAYDGTSLWVAESGERRIVQVGVEGTSIGQRVNVGRLPVGMAGLPDGRVFALAQTDKIVWEQRDGARGRKIATLKECPSGLAAGPKGLWVLTWPDCSSGTSRAVRIDFATGQQAATAELGEWGQAITVAHNKVWVAHARGGVITTINPQTLAFNNDVIAGGSFWSLTSNSTRVYAGGRVDEDNNQGLVVEIDPESGTVLNELHLNQRIAVMAADDATLVAVGEKGTIWTISTADLKVRGIINLGVGDFTPSSAIIIGGQLMVVAQQYQGENGAVFTVPDWR